MIRQKNESQFRAVPVTRTGGYRRRAKSHFGSSIESNLTDHIVAFDDHTKKIRRVTFLRDESVRRGNLAGGEHFKQSHDFDSMS